MLESRRVNLSRYRLSANAGHPRPTLIRSAERSRLARDRAPESVSAAGAAGAARDAALAGPAWALVAARPSLFLGLHRLLHRGACCWSSRGACTGRACASSPWSTPASMRSRSADPLCSGGVASGLGILLVLPVVALTVLADHRDAFLIAAVAALAVLVQQVFVSLTSRRWRRRLHDRRRPRRGAVPDRARHVAGRQPPARERGAGAAPGDRPRRTWRSCRSTSCSTCARAFWSSTPRTAIRLINESAAQILGRQERLPGRAARRGLAAAAVSAGDLAQELPAAPACSPPSNRPSSPPTARA